MARVVRLGSRRGGLRGIVEPLAIAAVGITVGLIGARVLESSAMFSSPEVTASAPQASVHFGICSGSRRVSCVVDGDTIWLRGEKIRIADIDTPEIFSPKCAGEKALGDRAKWRLQELLNAGPVEVAPYARNEDVYGRKLRILERDGRSIGGMLVSEGLAREWDGARRGWCAQGSRG